MTLEMKNGHCKERDGKTQIIQLLGGENSNIRECVTVRMGNDSKGSWRRSWGGRYSDELVLHSLSLKLWKHSSWQCPLGRRKKMGK